jgi:hypothetical protein
MRHPALWTIVKESPMRHDLANELFSRTERQARNQAHFSDAELEVIDAIATDQLSRLRAPQTSYDLAVAELSEHLKSILSKLNYQPQERTG